MVSEIVTLLLGLRQLVFCVSASARAVVEERLLPGYRWSQLADGYPCTVLLV